MTNAVPVFRPSLHGFPFTNWYPEGTPVLEVATPFGKVLLGDAHGGVCGGMVFATVDHFHLNLPVPQTATSDVVQYFGRRLLHSWHLPFGVLKYLDWQRRPGASKFLFGVNVLDGVSALTIRDEWPKVQANLDAGRLAPLGLIKVESYKPRDMGHNHQVLAYGYQLDGNALTLLIYDPNHPFQDSTTLTMTIDNPDATHPIVHSLEDELVRGFFLTEYLPAVPPWAEV